jgi:ribonuclease P/MRP protein subunit RPP1
MPAGSWRNYLAERSFYDLSVHSVPDGINTADELISMAKHLGFAGIGLSNHSTAEGPLQSDRVEGFDIFRTVELVASNPSKLHGLVGKYRNKVDVLAVHGGDEGINRAALENSNVDILLHPSTPKGSGLNHVLARSASENNVAIGFDVDSLIMSRGGRRVHSLSHFRDYLALSRKYDVPMLLTSNASSVFGLRAPREIIALAILFGMEKDEAISALSETPLGIVQKKRHDKNYVCEGVEILEPSLSVQEDE